MNLVRRTGTALLGAAALAGCVPPATFTTPSGNPETLIEGATKHAVMNAIVGSTASAGWSLQTSSEYQVVVTQPMTGIVGALMGSEANPVAVWRETLTLVEQGDGVRVIGAVAMVTNPGTGYEEVTDVTHGKAGQQLQEYLDDLGRALRPAAEGQPPVQPDVAMAPSLVPWALDRLGTGPSTFRIMVHGDSMGVVSLSWARTTDGERAVLRLTEGMAGGAGTGAGTIRLEDTVTMDAATLQPIRLREGGTWDGQPVRLTLDYQGTRLRGHVHVTGRDADVDTTLAIAALDRNHLEAVLPALPLVNAGRWTLRYYDGARGLVVTTKVSVMGEESVTVPAGTFACWKVDVVDDRGGGTYDVTKTAPYLVVKYWFDPSSPFELVGRAPSPLSWAQERLVPHSWTFQVMVQGTRIGQVTRALDRGTKGGRQVLHLTSSTRIGADTDMISLDDTTTVDAATLMPIQVRESGSWGGQPERVTLDYAGTHLRGHVHTLVGQAVRDADVDTTVAVTALGRPIETLLPAMPLVDGGRWTLTAYDAAQGAVRTTSLLVAGEETVTVPAGTFLCWKVEVARDATTVNYYVTKAAPYLVAKFETLIPAVSFELAGPAHP